MLGATFFRFTRSSKNARTSSVLRRSGDRWYLAAMNGEDGATLEASLAFLGKGKWSLRAFADKIHPADLQAVVESTREVSGETRLPMALAPGGGFTAIITKAK